MTEEDFVRVHPLSPFIRGGLIVLGVAGYLISQQIDRIAGALSGLGEGGEGGGTFPLVQAGVVLLTVVGAVLLGLVSWWFSRYRLGDDSLEMRTGVLFRQHRQVRYDRIQAVDIVRPLLARVTGLSEVRVESAGGGDSHLSIAYLRASDAEEVRERLLGLAHGASALTGVAERTVTTGAAPAETAPAQHVLSVPPARVVGSVLLSPEAIFLGLLAVAGVVLALLGQAPALGGIAPVAVLAAFRALMRLTRWWGLTLGLRGRTLTSQRGLTDTRTSSVPLHRVQAIEIEQPWLWRRPGWWSLKVNVAGADIGAAVESSSESQLVPAATTREVLHLLEVVLDDPGTAAEVRSLVDRTPEGFVGQPPRARWLHPVAHRHTGYLAGHRAAVTRSGRFARTLQVVPWGRIQSLTLTQGPLSRRLDLASVHLISTVGPVSPSVGHLDRSAAELLRDGAERRASRSRRGDPGGPACFPGQDTVDCDR